MTDQRTELLPCPNPWCEQSEPVTRRASGGAFGGGLQVVCARCGTAGPAHPNEIGAVAGWNTRKSVEPGESGEEAWRDAAEAAPEGQPVLALYRAWNRPNGRLMKHVVWWREGGWRIYPHRDNSGYVDRWRPLCAMN